MGAQLTVFVNACTAGSMRGGIPSYAREISAALARQPDVAVLFGATIEAPAGTTPVVPPERHRQLWTQFRLPRLMARLGADAYLGTEYNAPVFTRKPRAVLVHDLAHRFMPKLYTRQNLLHVRMLFATLRRAERLIAPTNAVADDIVRYLGTPRSRIRVIPEAPRSGVSEAGRDAVEAMRRELGLEGPYLLAVGCHNRHKRTIDLIRAAALLRARGLPVTLAVTGASTRELLGHLRREGNRLGVGERLRLLGEVPDDQLSALYTDAVALGFPSIMEGFGLPPFEAMVCGTPVIAADIPALRENLEGAAILVPPREPEQIADAVEMLLGSEGARGEWAARGRERAARFSWDRSAAETAEVLREIT